MYLPAHFNEARAEVLHARIAQHPFGTLITPGIEQSDPVNWLGQIPGNGGK